MKIKTCTLCKEQFWKTGGLTECPKAEDGEHVWEWAETKMSPKKKEAALNTILDRHFSKGGRMPTTKKRIFAAVTDKWAALVSKKGLGQRTGKETIVDKGWINEKGELIHHGMAQTHQEYAIQFLTQTEGYEGSGNRSRDLMTVDDILLKRGWIRVQIYANDGMGLQGLADAVKSYGHAALALLPKPKRVYVMDFPSNEVSLYTADDLAAIGLA